MRAQNKEVLLNDSVLLREKDLVPERETVPWNELVHRVNKFARAAMNREFDTKAEVLVRVEDTKHFIRTLCPEGNGYKEVLEGMMWAHVTARFEDTFEREARVFLIEANIRAQHGLIELRRLSFVDRVVAVQALQEGEGGEQRMAYLLGALAVARVAIAIEELGHSFQLATVDEDFKGGIDGWLVRRGLPRIPLDVKNGSGMSKDGRCVRPHTLSNKIKRGVQLRQRELLEGMGLEPRLLRVFAPAAEQGTILALPSRGALVEPLRRVLARWHRRPYLVRGNVNRPRLPRKRRH
jgi:hypothetical protein